MGIDRPLSSAEIYDPATGMFTLTGSMNTGRGGHAAVALKNGKVLVLGGESLQGGVFMLLSSVELYDPTIGTFVATNSMTTQRFDPTATALSNGDVLVTGGFSDISSAEVYRSAANMFVPTGGMSTARVVHTATLFGDGRVLVAGGQGFAQGADPLRTCEVYDPSTGIFTLTQSMKTARQEHTATLFPGGEVIIVGGKTLNALNIFGSTNSVEVFDPQTSTLMNGPMLNVARFDHTAVLLQNGKLLVAGGLDGNGVITASAEITR